MTKKDSLSIFFPFYNDAGTVEKMISDAFHYGGSLTNDLEVIAVNDGSQDLTLDELNKMKKKFPSLKIINHEKNQGYGGALISGITNSTKTWVFYTDGDAQYHLDELDKLWQHKDNFDVVNGYKLSRSDNIIRKWAGLSYRKLMKHLFKLPILDVDCDYRLMRGEILRSLHLESKTGAITVELVKKLSTKTHKFYEVGVKHYERVYGKSMFFTPRNIINTFRDEIKLFKKIRNAK